MDRVAFNTPVDMGLAIGKTGSKVCAGTDQEVREYVLASKERMAEMSSCQIGIQIDDL